MSTANHLTVRDYFDRVLLGNTAHGKGYTADRFKASESGRFHQLLTFLGNRQSSVNDLKSSGLTAVDYLRHPVRRNGLRHSKIMLASSEKKDASAVRASSSPTNLTCHDPSSKSLVSTRMEGKSQTTEERSAAAARIQEGLSDKGLIEKCIHKAARKYHLPVNLLTGVIKAESNFQATAVSSAGAQGLMQLMPDTAKELGVVDPFDIEQNIDGGARYLKKMLDSFGGDIKLALAAYNAGPGAVEKYGGQIPPYRETEQYVSRVLMFSKLQA